MQISTILKYPILVLLSTGKKSFENLGRFVGKSGDTISRLLQPSELSLEEARYICKSMFKNSRKLFLTIDDTLIKKFYSKYMQGAGLFFDSKNYRRVMAYKIIAGLITNGKFIIPINFAYLFSRELIESCSNKFESKDEIIRSIIRTAQELFPEIEITVVVDGLYSTVNFLRWCSNQKIRLEARMHCHRVIEYKGKKVKIKELLNWRFVCPKGRKMSRTISVIWHKIPLQLTIVRRIDKNGNESFVFLISTYKSKPNEHVENYKKRWPVEKFFRTTKQTLGLQECFSRSLHVQKDHVASVFLSFSLAQLEMKKSKLKTPEQAIRRLKTKNVNSLTNRFTRFQKPFYYFHA